MKIEDMNLTEKTERGSITVRRKISTPRNKINKQQKGRYLQRKDR